jgi:hypothetical protein
MSSLVRWIVLSLLALSTGLHAQADKKVREIVIRSYWGGLGTRQELTVTILGSPDGFRHSSTSPMASLKVSLPSRSTKSGATSKRPEK